MIVVLCCFVSSTCPTAKKWSLDISDCKTLLAKKTFAIPIYEYDFKSSIINSYFKSNYTVRVRFIININECKFVFQLMFLILFTDFPNTSLHSDTSPNIPDMETI